MHLTHIKAPKTRETAAAAAVAAASLHARIYCYIHDMDKIVK